MTVDWKRRAEAYERQWLSLARQYENMMTRRNVLEKLVDAAKLADYYRREKLADWALWQDWLVHAYCNVLHFDDILANSALDAAHELALMIDAEREQD